MKQRAYTFRRTAEGALICISMFISIDDKDADAVKLFGEYGVIPSDRATAVATTLETGAYIREPDEFTPAVGDLPYAHVLFAARSGAPALEPMSSLTPLEEGFRSMAAVELIGAQSAYGKSLYLNDWFNAETARKCFRHLNPVYDASTASSFFTYCEGIQYEEGHLSLIRAAQEGSLYRLVGLMDRQCLSAFSNMAAEVPATDVPCLNVIRALMTGKKVETAAVGMTLAQLKTVAKYASGMFGPLKNGSQNAFLFVNLCAAILVPLLERAEATGWAKNLDPQDVTKWIY